MVLLVVLILALVLVNPMKALAVGDHSEVNKVLTKVGKIIEFSDYKNPEFRIDMKYPSDWEIQENDDHVAFTSKPEIPDDLSASVFVYYEGNIPLFGSKGETMKKYRDAAIELRKSFKDFELLSSNTSLFMGKDAIQLEYIYKDPNVGDAKARRYG
jgi:hypothetical protein